ncbi:hypothetical protein GCM10009735_09500 [Actinomadura chokoriensis]
MGRFGAPSGHAAPDLWDSGQYDGPCLAAGILNPFELPHLVAHRKGATGLKGVGPILVGFDGEADSERMPFPDIDVDHPETPYRSVALPVGP